MKWTKTTMGVACTAAILIAGTIGIIERNGNPKTAAPEAPAQLTQLSPQPKLSPFTAVKFTGDTVTVTFSGTDYQLAAIDDLTVSGLLDFCKQQYGDAWQKRFAEDLVVVFEDLGHPLNPDGTVSLALADPKTGEKKTIAHALMTAENRHAVHEMLSMK